MRTQRYEFQGLKVPVETWGCSSETLVFLPGLGCHPKHYRRGFERLAGRVRIVSPDLSFRTHERLPTGPDEYYELVRALAGELAPGAVWAGHSFGALVALRHYGPAIACAPSVPAEVGLPRMFGRAVRQQVREYLGFEGWHGATYALSVMVDYVGTSLRRPRTIFPSIAALNAPASTFEVRSREAVVYLCEKDELYRPREYRAYFGEGSARVRLKMIDDCHDWPITNPRGLEERITAALDELRTLGAT